MIDLLVEQGYGRELILEDDILRFHTYDNPKQYASSGITIRVIGGWLNVANDKNNSSESEDTLIAKAFCKAKDATDVRIHARNLFIDGEEFGKIVSKAQVSDGIYDIINPGRPGKSQILHIAECQPQYS